MLPGERDWPPLKSPNWRPLFEAIEFLRQCFGLIDEAVAELYAALVTRAVPSIRKKVVGGRVVRQRLRGWKKIDLKIRPSIHNPESWRDDVEIAVGNLRLYPDKIFVWWPDVERLGGLTVAQPEPAPVSVPALAPRHAGGSPAKHEWEAAARHVDDWVAEHGPLPRNDKGEPILARAVELMTEWFERNDPPPPKPRSVRRWIKKNPRTWWGPN